MRLVPTSVLLHAVAIAVALPASSVAQCPISVPCQSCAGTVVAHDARTYFAGGDHLGASDEVAIFDEMTGAWSSAQLSQPRSWPAGVAVGDFVLFGGGADAQLQPLAVVDVYDRVMDAWITTNLPTPRFGMSAGAAGGLAVFCGGYQVFPNWLPVIETYEPASGAWSIISTQGLPIGAFLAAVGGKAFFADGTVGPGSITDEVYLYDFQAGAWSTETLSLARQLYGVVTSGQRVFFAGGATGSSSATSTDVVDVYDAVSDTWSVMTMPEPRAQVGTACLGDRLLIGGGYGPAGSLDDTLLLLDLPTGSWIVTSLPDISGRPWITAARRVWISTQGGLRALTAPLAAPFCFGDGTGGACACNNPGAAGHGCAGSTGTGARLEFHGWNCLAEADDLRLRTLDVPVGALMWLFVGEQRVGAGSGAAFGDGLRCTRGGVRRLGQLEANAIGAGLFGPGLAASGGWAPGDVRRFQVWYRDPVGPCGLGFNTTNGVEMPFGT